MARVGKYELLELLGKGGMGEVWRARDVELGRVVALKRMQGGDADIVTRFKREARMVARLSHPHIAQLYEVTEDPPAIAFQCVDGARIDEAPQGLRTRIEGLAQAARAVHYAHGQGVIHRDLKPANILLDESGRGMVLDFGLAREVRSDATALSLSGDVLGTPLFMAPEQALGRVNAVDARTDVYGLGATLYALIAGRPPHEGGTVLEVVHHVIHGEIAPPGGGRDLATVCMKALDREPERRYATAEAFAQDLERYLAGEPVVARPASLAYRVRSRIRKRPALYGLGTALVVVLAAATALQMRSSRQIESERQKQYRVAWGILRPLAAQVDDFEDLNCRTGIAQEEIQRLLVPVLNQTEALMREHPGFAPAAAWHARLLELTGREAEADAEYDRACGLSADSAEAWYLRGMRRVSLYHRHREPAPVVSSAARVRVAAAPPETPEHRRWRTGAMEDFETMRRLASRDPEFDATKDRRGRATLKLCSQDPPEALRGLEGLDDPRSRYLRGLALLGLLRADEARQEFDAVLKTWPNHAEALIFRARTWMMSADLRERRLEDPTADYEAGIADATECLKRHPAYVDPLLIRGTGRADVGRWRFRRGVNAEPDFVAAAVDLDAYLKFHPAEGSGLGHRAMLWLDLALCKTRRGEDPTAEFASALKVFSSAMDLEPDDPTLPANRAMTRMTLAEWKHQEGANASEDARAAERDLERALSIDPTLLEARMNLGNARLVQGMWNADAGVSPVKLYEKSVEDFTAVLGMQPGFSQVLNSRGTAWMHWGYWKDREHEESAGSFERAIDDFNRAIAADPGHAEAYNNRAAARIGAAQVEAKAGGDPTAGFAEAVRDATAAIERNGAMAEPHYLRGNARFQSSQWSAARGADVEEDLRRAIDDFTLALERNGRLFAALRARAVARVHLGDALATGLGPADPRARAAAEAYRRAAEDFEKYLDEFPDTPEAAVMEGWIRRSREAASRLAGDDY